MEVAAASNPRRVDEADRLDDERVAFPASNAYPHIRQLEVRIFGLLAAVDRDDAVLAVSTARIATLIEEGDVGIRLPDAPRRAASTMNSSLVRPRISMRLSTHRF